MPLAAGAKLGPYQVLSQIGAGGMGVVYRAKDTRLSRDVAVKVSAERFGDRFEREARSIAQLNHPHICTLYDVGPNYLPGSVKQHRYPEYLKHPATRNYAVGRWNEAIHAFLLGRGLVQKDKETFYCPSEQTHQLRERTLFVHPLCNRFRLRPNVDQREIGIHVFR